MRNKKFAAYILALAIIFSLVVSGCGNRQNAAVSTEKEKIVPVKVAIAQQENLPEYRTFPGKIAALNEMSIVPKMGGKVEQILVKEGDSVKAGQTIIMLEQKDVLSQVNQAQAAYEAAMTQLNNLKNGQLPQQIAQLEAAVSQAEANFNNAEKNYERMKTLLDEEAITQQQFEAAELQYKVAKEQYESAKTQLELTKEKTAPGSIDLASAQVKQAEAALSAAKTALDNCVITSPVNGVIGSITAKVGQLVAAGYSVATVGDLNTIEIQINVTEDKVTGLKVGQEAEISSDALGDTTLKGKVVSVSPFKDARTQVYPVKVQAPNENNILKSGMFARVKLTVELHENVVTVPEDAIVYYNGTSTIYTIENDVAKALNVEVGPVSMGKTIIKSGLEPGAEIIVEGQEFVTDGMKVKVEGRGESK